MIQCWLLKKKRKQNYIGTSIIFRNNNKKKNFCYINPKIYPPFKITTTKILAVAYAHIVTKYVIPTNFAHSFTINFCTITMKTYLKKKRGFYILKNVLKIDMNSFVV